MIFVKKILILLIFCICSYSSEEINSNDFEKTLQTNDIVIVDFYTDWCGWCNKLQNYVNKNNLKTYKINAELNEELSKKYKIKSYPTLIVFKNGNQINKVSGYDQTINILNKYNIKN